ncbi:MAG: GNAT family N-acetyltransferase [Bdellovibrionales bacterium]|nr:GNAT family N-acetyltransferase [Bdellovibrionales bacterium]
MLKISVEDFNGSLDREKNVRDIFFLTTKKKTFLSIEAKNSFYERWMSFYLKGIDSGVLLAINEVDQVCGYLSYCIDSKRAKFYFSHWLSYYDLFEDLYAQYPAHLHINAHPDFQGQGVGKTLVHSLIQRLQEAGGCGLHLVTDPDANNVQFYKKMGFLETFCRQINGQDYLFMGQRWDFKS